MLLVEEIEVPQKPNDLPQVPDFISSCKSNINTITTTTFLSTYVFNRGYIRAFIVIIVSAALFSLFKNPFDMSKFLTVLTVTLSKWM